MALESQFLETGENLKIPKRGRMKTGSSRSSHSDPQHAAARARINETLQLRVGLAVEGPAHSDAASPGSLRAERVQRMVLHLGHDLSSSDAVKLVVNPAGSARLIATRDIPRGATILQIPWKLRFSIGDLSAETGVCSPHLLHKRINKGIRDFQRAASAAGHDSHLHRRLTFCGSSPAGLPSQYVAVCLLLAARHKLRSAEPSQLSQRMRM